MRIIFIGTPEFAVPSLKILLENNYNIVAVITAPDKPAGRGQKVSCSAIKEYAQKQNLLILQPLKLKDPDFLEYYRSLAPDLQVVVAFRKLPKEIWAFPKLGTFNLHASLLPNYRGAAPINWAIINGEKVTGLTTFFLEEEIDTGKIIFQKPVPIPENWNAGQLHDYLKEEGAKLVLETVRAIEKGTAPQIPQVLKGDEKKAPKIYPKDGKIDWNKTAKEIHNLIRGLAPNPAAWCYLNGKTLKIFSSQVYYNEEENASTGTIKIIHPDTLLIKAADNWLKILEVQLEGKKRMDIRSFLNGFREQIVIT
ncbi:MAG: methionyl-tRNA formyltransferase [Bacteroidia bacterium]|nr:methionyl-tRNA formyltransferase [Bacteroidia bacterium]MDW8158842.1 methionyl-tRNA formyltransferase [Bacteroidia bacterium]